MPGGLVRHGYARIVLLRVDGRRAGVRDPDPARLGRVEHVHGAAHVDGCPVRRIGPDLWDQQRRQVDDVRDPVAVERRVERRAVDDVAPDDGDVGVGRQPQPPPVLAEVEADDLDALLRKDRTRPRPDAAERTGDEEALAHGST